MTADPPDWADDLSALAAAGALTDEEAAAFAARPDAAAALAAWEPAVLALTADLPPVAPPPALKDRLLAAVAPLPAGYTIRQPNDSGFRPTPYPGVTVRMLHIDRLRRQFACLMRIAPGARLPHHPHAGAEECVVMEGSIRVGGVTMGPGAYQRVEAGVDHLDQWSETGATVYLNAPLELLELPV
jgi:ChrR Cupin-like domain